MTLLLFGAGYSAYAFARRHRSHFGRIIGTTRSSGRLEALAQQGIEPRLFDAVQADPRLAADIGEARAILISIPPDAGGDPVIRHFAADIAAAPNLAWIGYLSTIGVYGDHQGAWVDETTPCHPQSARSQARLAAEQDWTALARQTSASLQIFRLSGIYGPGRNALLNLKEGTARRVIKPGQVFNRIHVGDIVGAISAGLAMPGLSGIYNVTDDEPAPPQDVVTYAAQLLGIEPPPEIPLDEADLSPMALSFYAENKRASNARLKSDLGYRLNYPTYREGLAALLPSLAEQHSMTKR